MVAVKIKLSKLTNPLLAMPTTFAFSGFFILELEMDKYKQYEEAKKQLQKLN